MPTCRPLSLAISIILAGAWFASPASAAWFPGDAIDGPSAEAISMGDVDLARDGTGGLVYLKREGGVAHVFLSRMIDGAWLPPERVDAPLATDATAATITAGDGRRLVIAFVSGGKLYGSAAAGGGALGPLSAPQVLAEGTPAAPVTDPASDLGVNGTAYVAFTAGGNVGAVRLESTTWEGVTAVLDVNPSRVAGVGAGRAQVAVSAEGNAVATWAEDGADGRRRVYGRRITGLTPSAAPQEVSLPDLAGVPGGAADSPDIDIEDDGSYAWVVWRQDFGGASRSVARRLVGSLFEAPVALDGGAASASPRVSISGRGIGASVVAAPGGTVFGGVVDKTKTFGAFARVDSTGGAADVPALAVAERRQAAVAWRREPGGGAPATIQARYKVDGKPYEAETTLSNPSFGPVAGAPAMATDKNGDFAVAFVQGVPGSQRLVAAVYDKPPAPAAPQSTSRYQRRSQPRLVWRPSLELWGTQTFKVLVDGIEVGTTDKNEFFVPTALPDGPHRWRVQSTDRRGQVVSNQDRLLRVDSVAPRTRVTVTGTRRRGRAVRVRVSADDGRGSGLARVTVGFGDGSRSARRLSVHRYRRPGRFRLVVRVADRAGNVATTTVRLRIRR